MPAHIVHDPAVLPHNYLPEEIAELFPEAVPEEPHRGEDDLEPVNELRDPVPELRRQRLAVSTKHRNQQPRDAKKQ